MKTNSSLALAAALAFTAFAAEAQENVVKVGITRYDTHSRTDGISGIGVPPGADAEVGDATTVIFVYERLFTPNVGLEFVLGVPPRLKAKATGSVAFLGDDVLSAKNVAPTLLLNYSLLHAERRVAAVPRRRHQLHALHQRQVEPRPRRQDGQLDRPGAAGRPQLRDQQGHRPVREHRQAQRQEQGRGGRRPVLTTTVDFRPLVYSAGLSYQF